MNKELGFNLGVAFIKGYLYGQNYMAIGSDSKEKWRTTKKGKHYLINEKTGSVVKGNIGIGNVNTGKANKKESNRKNNYAVEKANAVIKKIQDMPVGSTFKEKLERENKIEALWSNYERDLKKESDRQGYLASSGVSTYKDRDLGSEFSKEVQNIYNKKVDEEKRLTPLLNKIFMEIGGVDFLGLPNSIKSASSTARKLKTKKLKAEKEGKKNFTYEKEINALKDIVRYTAVVSEHNNMCRTAKTLIQKLKEQGYNVIVSRNSYLDKEPPYKGLHLNISSKDGNTQEIQIHSNESLDVKRKNHPYYSIERDPNSSVKEQMEAKNKMIEISSKLITPPGLQELVKGYKGD